MRGANGWGGCNSRFGCPAFCNDAASWQATARHLLCACTVLRTMSAGPMLVHWLASAVCPIPSCPPEPLPGLGLQGCAVEGSWRLTHAKPDTARQDHDGVVTMHIQLSDPVAKPQFSSLEQLPHPPPPLSPVLSLMQDHWGVHPVCEKHILGQHHSLLYRVPRGRHNELHGDYERGRLQMLRQ